MEPTIETTSKSTDNRSQSWIYEETLNAWPRGKTEAAIDRGDEIKLRIRIERNAYDGQSSARVEAWTTEGWSYLTQIPIGQTPASKISYTHRQDAILNRRLDATRDELIAQALRILA